MIKYKKKAVSKLLRAYIKKHYGTHEAAGKKWKISRSYVSMLVNNPDLAPDRILRRVGVRRNTETHYEEIG